MKWLLNNRLAQFNCQDFGLETEDFTDHVLALLQDASWDRYDVRRRRLAFLLSTYPDHHDAVMSIYREYYLGAITAYCSLSPIIFLLNKSAHFSSGLLAYLRNHRLQAIGESII